MLDDCINHPNKPSSRYVRLNQDDGSSIGAHRLAYINKYGPVPRDLVVCHKCDNPTCVNVDHLFIGTYQDNMDDMVGKGRSLFGEKNPNNVLSEADVMNIRRSYYDGASAKRLAEEYHTTAGYVYAIVWGKTWKHLPTMPDKKSGGKLNPVKAQNIREMSKSGTTGRYLAKLFGVSTATISRILSNKTFEGGAA